MRLLLLALLACTPTEPDPTPKPGTGTPAGTPGGTTSTGTPGGTPGGTTTGSTTTTVDCSNLPAGPVGFNTLYGLYAAEDFAFDDTGHLIAHNQNALFKHEYPPGAVTAFAPTDGGPGGPASLRALSTGELVLANVDTATLALFDTAGARSVLHSGLGYPTGIDILPNDDVVLADLVGVLRITPSTGTATTILNSGVLQSPNGLTYNADRTVLYIGTYNEIYSMPVDANGDPTAAPALWASSPGGGELLGMGVDACDNVYAIRAGHQLLRWPSTGGTAEIVMEVPPGAWMTNLQWGSGVGGWLEDHIYVTDRSLQSVYYEVDVGVPSKPY